MEAAGLTKSNVTAFYNNVRQCLLTNNFHKQKQWSIYTSDRPNSLSDAFAACIALKEVANADGFVKRLQLFRVEDFNDLLPLVANGKASAEQDEIVEEIAKVTSLMTRLALLSRVRRASESVAEVDSLATRLGDCIVRPPSSV